MDHFCGNCGARLDPSGRCPQCGWTLSAEPAPKKKKKKTKVILLLIAMLLAALLIASLLHVFGLVELPLLGKVLGVFGIYPIDGPREIPEQTVERPAAEDYLSELGAVSGQTLAKTADLYTEAEAIRQYAARGFTDVKVSAFYDEKGTYLGRQTCTADGTQKHPYYEASYFTPDQVVWTVTLIGDAFYAEPVSYQAEGRWDAPRVLSETDDFQTYDGRANTIYTITPGTALVVKRVEKIDAAALNEMDAWEVVEP